MKESPDDFPEPDLATDFRRRSLRDRQAERLRIGTFLLWTSFAMFLVSFALGPCFVGMILSGDGPRPHGSPAGVLLMGLPVGVSISLLLSLIACVFHRRALSLVVFYLFVLIAYFWQSSLTP